MVRADIIERMPEEQRAEHRESIRTQFASFRRSLDELAYRMYTEHFLKDPKKSSPEYAAIVEATARMEQTALEKYKPR